MQKYPITTEGEVFIALTEAQERILNTFYRLDLKHHRNWYQITPDLFPNTKPGSVKELVIKGYLQQDNVINNFGKVVSFYRYSGKHYEINDANLLSLIEEEKKKKAEK